MIVARRSVNIAGAALLGAGLIATSTVTPVHLAAPRLSDVAVQLQSSVLDIFTFPAFQQSIANEVEFVAIRAAGALASGAGLAESLAALPATLITAAQQTFAGDLLGALTTLEEAAIGAAEATLIPYVAAQIEVGQIQLAIDSALLPARPIAAVELGAGLFAAFDAVARALITAGQNFVSAVLSFNIADIVAAVVGGVTGVIAAFGTGGQDAVDGIVAAQTTLATALAARPTPPVTPVTPLEAASVAPAAAVQQSAPASIQPLNEAAPASITAGPITAAPITAGPITAGPTAAGPMEAGATADRNENAPAAVDADISDVSAADPAPRRTSVRAAQRAESDNTAGPKKPGAKRVARATAAN